ncbi:hypothetical protein TWF173_004647 [Orbilia oligospora]|uniref:Ricin B lectin domain-containing protein n=1 Tax=Arthrobotrys oligospora (strain ATCC 24927 / CBS 115.81 / DSM 1491) TaxID=756982 RepID=G1XNJ8_ARTOA|nr:hypothetical protein AOL_s00173g16 [Orbilia oligospora ATCC 24927]EGX44915.1 hypothetical protein AOL_s00173g16 [Orbilia oligospora ATCC 24927]KAF3314563.1 hypothetical protein TWF173_004647 [Orbilia oligospora]
MSLPSASYFIIGSYGSYQYSVGRAPAEDKSLNPKQVYLLRPSAVGMTPWVLIRTPHGYVLKIKEAPTGIVNDAVVAILNLNLTRYVEWGLEPVPGEQDHFRIRGPNGQYWTVDDRDTQNGRRIVLREGGEGSQTFTFLRLYGGFAEEEEKYSRPVDSNQRDYDSERNRDDDRQGVFGYGKREKKFCS